MLRRRAPSGTVVDTVDKLDVNTWYRTPMDDSGHLWDGRGNGTLCGRYLEYPWYYQEGWDQILGPYWVQEDDRKGGKCALCKAQRKVDEEDKEHARVLAEAAKKYGVTARFPAEQAPDRVPAGVKRWSKTASRLYVG